MTRLIVALIAGLLLAAPPLAMGAWAQTANPTTATSFVTQQPSNEWLAHVFFGAPVQNQAGEVIGDINDLVFSPTGQISTVVLGIGGVLGIGEKSVAVPYSALSFKLGADGVRVIMVGLTKEQLVAAPAFQATEKTTYDSMKDKAIALSKKASAKVGELKDQAVKKVEDMKSDAPKKQ